MSLSTMGSYSAFAGNDRLYPITIQIKNAHGGWTSVSVLSDTGNEISIMKREIADLLGLDLATGESFMVGGINGKGREFRRFRLPVKIGSLQPILVTIGFAINHGDLAENLLGNADILKTGKFQVTYDEKGVTYQQKALAARVSSCGSSYHENEQETLNNLYDHLTTRRRREKNNHCCGSSHENDVRDGGGYNSIPTHGLYY